MTRDKNNAYDWLQEAREAKKTSEVALALGSYWSYLSANPKDIEVRREYRELQRSTRKELSVIETIGQFIAPFALKQNSLEEMIYQGEKYLRTDARNIGVIEKIGRKALEENDGNVAEYYLSDALNLLEEKSNNTRGLKKIHLKHRMRKIIMNLVKTYDLKEEPEKADALIGNYRDYFSPEERKKLGREIGTKGMVKIVSAARTSADLERNPGASIRAMEEDTEIAINRSKY